MSFWSNNDFANNHQQTTVYHPPFVERIIESIKKMLTLIKINIDYKEFLKEFNIIRKNIYNICDKLKKEYLNDTKEMKQNLNVLETFQQYWQNNEPDDDEDEDEDKNTFNVRYTDL